MAEDWTEHSRLSSCTKTRQQLEEALATISNNFVFEDAHIELISQQRVNELVDFLNVHFHADETLAKAVGLRIDDEVTHFYRKMLEDNHHSIILVSNSTDEIIACRTIFVESKGHSLKVENIKNEGLKLLMTFLGRTDGVNVYDKFNVDSIVHFDGLATHKYYRGKGIAPKMIKISTQFSKMFGISPCIVKVEGTSNISQAILEKQGFKVIDTFRYDTFQIDDECHVFNDTGPNQTMKVYVKQL